MSTLQDIIEIETGPNPTAAVVWLHGLGADGNDFVPIVRELDLTGCPAIRFVFPTAPSMPVTINGGYVMNAWYDILNQDLVRREDEGGLRASEKLVAALIDKEISRGIAPENIVLAGFSQGCAMTLQTGLRYPKKLAGLLGLSGYAPLAGTIAAERSPANQDTPVMLMHGTQDPIVVIGRAEASRDLLTSLDYDVSWKTYPMPHSVCGPQVADISAWLQQRLR